MPDISLLNRIKKQHVYLDRKSKEQFYPYKEKRKYKLAGNPLLDNYFFHVLTTGKDACTGAFTIALNRSDWENMTPKSKMEDVGYCDVTNYELIQRAILLQKMKDKKNGFPTIARLSDLKYQDILDLCENYCRKIYASKETKETLRTGTVASNILIKLNLK